MKVLVTGGAGYVGSHTCVELLEAGHEVFVVDNLSNGHEYMLERIRSITNCTIGFMKADIRDTNELKKIFTTFRPDAVMHFAGLKAVGESVSDPLLYYNVNVCGSISLLEAMTSVGCSKIVFSSSATVYGNPQYLPYDESHPTCPINPYGRSKLMIEQIINDWINRKKGNNGIMLRYFNPVGAHPTGQIGEEPRGIPNNLMPYIAQVASGRREYLNIFGNDYETKDGTGSRDYIHVMDLANAHKKALEFQNNYLPFEIINIGSGKAITVLELIKSFQKVSGISINYRFVSRRAGDLPTFWANTSRAFDLLGWYPKFDIDQMCKDTWNWQKSG